MRSPYEIRCESSFGEELDFIIIHLAVDQYLGALEAQYPGRTDTMEVVDFFGRDQALGHVCLGCAEMLAARMSAVQNLLTQMYEFRKSGPEHPEREKV